MQARGWQNAPQQDGFLPASLAVEFGLKNYCPKENVAWMGKRALATTSELSTLPRRKAGFRQSLPDP